MLWCGRMGKQAGRPDRPTPPRGLFSREIGEQLYLSHRTVAAHLYRIFPKFGVVRTSTCLPLSRTAGRQRTISTVLPGGCGRVALSNAFLPSASGKVWL
jgi:hypothetical protein